LQYTALGPTDFILESVTELPALVHYIDTGMKLKNASNNSGIDVIENGIDRFVKHVKINGNESSTAVFCYLDGSSGLGKTQLAFALWRNVLYIPLGKQA
jgi:hypothetical protein